MKKLLLILILLTLPHKCEAINVGEYLNKPYIGISYEKGLTQEIPFILVFANSKDVFSIMKLLPIGEMVYDEFKGKYNFCILNTKMQENEELFNAFKIDERLPVMVVINPKTQTFYQIDKKHFNKKDLRKILNQMYINIISQ